MRLVGTGQNRERIEKWVAELKEQIDTLPGDQVGSVKDEQLNGMKTALELWLSADPKLKGAGERSLHEVHDGNGKLLSAVFTQYNRETNVSSIESIGGLEHASLVKALQHMVTHEEKDNHAERIEMTVFDDDTARLSALNEVGFQPDPGATGHGVKVMIRGSSTTQAEKARAERMSLEHQNKVLGASQAAARLLGYDPKLVRISMDDHTFDLAGTQRHAAGLAHLTTGVITIFPNYVYSTDGAVSVTAHEVAHQKYQTVLNYLQKEYEALGEAERQAQQQQQPPLTNFGGELKPEYREQFPLITRFEKHKGDALDRRIKTDGITDYSKDYWKDYAKDKGIVALKVASHETIAEIARRQTETGKIEGSPAWRSYYKDVMKSYDEIQEKLKAAKAA